MRVGSFLRHAREKRGLTLTEISQQTNIKLALLIGLENNDVSRWPKQRVYRHGHLQAYASALGLEPATVLEWFDAEFGDPHPVAFHGRPKKPIRPLPFGFVRYAVLLASLAIVAGAAVQVPEAPPSSVELIQPVGPPGRADNDNNEEAQPLVDPAPPPPLAAATDTDQSADAVESEEFDIEGELRITSSPPRAHVTVNGIGRGSTPLRVRYLPLGSYTVRVIHPGYKIRETRVTLKAERPRRTVRVVLRDAPAYVSAMLGTPGPRLH